MTTEISLSYQRTQAQFTSVQVNSRERSLALAYKDKNPSDILSRQQQQIVDEVGISEAAVKQFEEAQKLAAQLEAYNDYLYGRGGGNSVRLKKLDGQATVYVAGQSSELSASITTAQIHQETLDIKAQFDDDGNLQELSVKKTEINVEYISAELITRDTQFFGVSQV